MRGSFLSFIPCLVFAQAVPAAAQETPSARPSSNASNPAVSANGLVLLGGASEDARGDGDLSTGIHLQEVELRLGAVVDPYFRADLTLAATEEEIGFEEAYLSTLEIPHVTLRAGQMFAAFGRHNLLHTHAFPFLTAPLPSRALLGNEGLKDPGVSADVLLPLPFFVEVNAQLFAGDWTPFEGGVEDDPSTSADESVPDARRDEDFVYLGHLKTLFEVGREATLELGGSYAGGRNGWGKRTDVVGVDLTVKWRPLARERYTGVEWSSELLWNVRHGDPDQEKNAGAFTSLRVQMHQRWWVQGRAALLGLDASQSDRTWRTESLLAFVPSEFSALRLQYAYETAEASRVPDVHEVFLQALFSIGPHAPHDY